MTRNMDRRVRRSRAAIFAAFEALLREKSYGSITVGDIIEAADVGRTTFYAHFDTKDALLTELCRDIFSHVAAPSPEKDHDFSNADLKDQLLHTLCHLQDERVRLAPLLSSPSSDLFWSALEGQLEAYFQDKIGSAIASRQNVPNKLYALHLSRTFTETLRWWFEEDGCRDAGDALALFLALSKLVIADDVTAN